MRHGFKKQESIDSTLYYSIILKFFKNQNFTRMQQEIRSELRTDLIRFEFKKGFNSK
jgi:hypothetical protein